MIRPTNPLRKTWRGFRHLMKPSQIPADGKVPDDGFQRANFFCRNRSSFALAPLFAALLVAFVCGCGRTEPRADLVIVNGAEPESLDPAIISGFPDMRVVVSMFEGLLRLDPKTAQPRPAMAKRWEISPDGLHYTFHMRTNLVWSTGEPIRAEDVVYSWIRALKPETASEYAGQLFYIKNAEDFNAGKIKDPNLVAVHAPDPFTVEVELRNPTAFFLDLCAFQTLCVVPRRAIEKYGDNWLLAAHPLPCNGAYQLVTWRINDKVRVTKNTNYWDAANTHINTVDYLPIGNATTALNLYETGQADIVWDKTTGPTELLDVLLKRPDFFSFTILGNAFIRCNCATGPFKDPRVRRALSMTVDRERIVNKITKCGELPAYNFTPPGINHYQSPGKLADYDCAKARQLLAEAGYPGGKGFPTVGYMFNSNSKVGVDMAVELQQMWHDELGIQIELHEVEWKVYLSKMSTLDYELCGASWIGDYNDPDTFLNMMVTDGGNNRTGWSNKKYDDLIRKADEEADETRRIKMLQEAETLLIREEEPVIPLYFYVGFQYYNPKKIHGMYPNLLDNHPVSALSMEADPKP